MPITTAFGVLIGVCVVLWAPFVVSPAIDAYDAYFPVAEPVSSEIIGRDDDSVIVHIVMQKNRDEECRILRVYADTFDASDVRGSAMVTRPDGKTHSGINHSAGVRDVGLWRIKPVQYGAVKTIVYAEHDCVGRVARSIIAVVPLT
jgi:hypothetical protein